MEDRRRSREEPRIICPARCMMSSACAAASRSSPSTSGFAPPVFYGLGLPRQGVRRRRTIHCEHIRRHADQFLRIGPHAIRIAGTDAKIDGDPRPTRAP
jgi:hypothetical protein